MSLAEKIAKIENHQDLAGFIKQLRQAVITDPDQWENGDLSSYLEAMSAWIADAEGYYQNAGQPMPNTETWKTVAAILYASLLYE